MIGDSCLAGLCVAVVQAVEMVRLLDEWQGRLSASEVASEIVEFIHSQAHGLPGTGVPLRPTDALPPGPGQPRNLSSTKRQSRGRCIIQCSQVAGLEPGAQQEAQWTAGR